MVFPTTNKNDSLQGMEEGEKPMCQLRQIHAVDSYCTSGMYQDLRANGLVSGIKQSAISMHIYIYILFADYFLLKTNMISLIRGYLAKLIQFCKV